MSRTDNYVGLSDKAEKWLQDQLGSQRFAGKVYIEFEGAFGNRFSLFEYETPAGTQIREIIQAEPWASGPCFFITLRMVTSHGMIPIPDLDWTEAEIEDRI